MEQKQKQSTENFIKEIRRTYSVSCRQPVSYRLDHYPISPSQAYLNTAVNLFIQRIRRYQNIFLFRILISKFK